MRWSQEAADRLADVMRDNNMCKADLSKAIGTTQTHIARLLLAKVKAVHSEKLAANLERIMAEGDAGRKLNETGAIRRPDAYEVVAAEYRGHAMVPVVQPGQTLYGRINANPADGEICIIALRGATRNEQEITVRYWYGDGAHVVLQAVLKSEPPRRVARTDVVWAAPVVRPVSRVKAS